MATTTYSGLSQRTEFGAIKNHLDHARPIECLARFGKTYPVPKNKSKDFKFRRPVPLALATTALTEGVPPTGKALTYEDVQASLSQYGDFVNITDVVQDLAEDPVLKDATELTGEQAAETVETLLWGILQAGTNVHYANGAARADVNSVISLNKQRAITRQMKANRAKKVTKMAKSSVNMDSVSIDAAFIAFAHTDLESDIRALTGFKPVEDYATKALPYEIGKVEDVRYILSPVLESFADAGGAAGSMVSTTGTSADVYSVIYISKDCYGHIALKGKDAVEIKVKNPGTVDSGDPLGQKGTIGWKCYWKGLITNEMWMARLECAVTDL